jgi:hypothetical protein
VFRGTRELLSGRVVDFAYGTITLYGCPFQGPSTIANLVNFPGKPQSSPTTPYLLPGMVWAVPCSLAATGGISDLISLPSGTEMFHFPEFASTRL